MIALKQPSPQSFIVAAALVCAGMGTSSLALAAPPPQARLCVIHRQPVVGLERHALQDALTVELRKAELAVTVSQVVRSRDCPRPEGGERAAFLRIEDAEQLFFVDDASQVRVLDLAQVAPIDRSQAVARRLVSSLLLPEPLPPVTTAVQVPAPVAAEPVEWPTSRRAARPPADPWYENPVGWFGLGAGTAGLTLGLLLDNRLDGMRSSDNDLLATMSYTLGFCGLTVGVLAFAVDATTPAPRTANAIVAPTVLADGSPGIVAALGF